MKFMTKFGVCALSAALMMSCGALAGCGEKTPASSGGEPQEQQPQGKDTLLVENMRTELGYSEDFKTGGAFSVTLKKPDGTERVLKAREYTVDSSAVQKGVPGTYTVKVTAEGAETSYPVKVLEKQKWEEDGVLKILLIGSSYTEDTFAYAWQICNSLGIEAEIAALEYVGDLDALNSALRSGGTGLEIWMTSKETGGGIAIESGKSAEAAIKSRNWDFITIHHQSSRAGVEGEFTSLEPALEKLRGFISGDTRLAWLLTWAYRELYENETPLSVLAGQYGTYENYFNSDQMTMYRALVQTAQKKVVPTGLEIVPIGTALQNLRTSFVGDTLTRDLIHLSLGMGRYTAAMTLISALTGRSMEGIDWMPTQLHNDSSLLPVAIESVQNALKTPFGITQSKYTK